jgi:pyruvate dehydrogenase E1 component alpha subunit
MGRKDRCLEAAWLGEEELAGLNELVRGLRGVAGASVAGSIVHLGEGDTLWLAGDKGLLGILGGLEWPDGGEGPRVVSGWKAARERAEFGGVTLVVCGMVEEEGVAGLSVVCREAMRRAQAGRWPMVFAVESRGDLSRLSRKEEESLPEILVDGGDLVAVFRVAQEAIARARRGQGPALIHCRMGAIEG